MRRFVLTCVAALAFAAPPVRAQIPAVAEAPTPLRYGDAIEQARAIAQQLVDSLGLPGLSVAVGADGKIVWSEGFGWADIENRVPVTTESRFRIGSVSKPVTAAALGLLHQRGQLDYDAIVQTYVPYFPAKRWPITVRQVAGHIAGIRHYRGTEFLIDSVFPTVRQSLGIFSADSLMFQPGTDYSYSSYGWNLLSAVVEGASGEEFLTFIRREVFEPLGLRSITAEHMDSLIDHRVRYYTRSRDGRLMNAPYVNSSSKWAGGGFSSNTEDLVRFGLAHLEGSLLTQTTIAEMWQPQTLANGESTGYGIGWQQSGEGAIGHSGSSVGGRARLLVLPEAGVVVAWLTNTDHAGVSLADTRRIADLFVRR